MLDQVRVGAILRVISFGRGIGSTVSQAKSCMPISLHPGGNSGVEERHSLGSTHKRCLGGWRETFPGQHSQEVPWRSMNCSKVHMCRMTNLNTVSMHTEFSKNQNGTSKAHLCKMINWNAFGIHAKILKNRNGSSKAHLCKKDQLDHCEHPHKNSQKFKVALPRLICAKWSIGTPSASTQSFLNIKMALPRLICATWWIGTPLASTQKF